MKVVLKQQRKPWQEIQTSEMPNISDVQENVKVSKSEITYSGKMDYDKSHSNMGLIFIYQNFS